MSQYETHKKELDEIINEMEYNLTQPIPVCLDRAAKIKIKLLKLMNNITVFKTALKQNHEDYTILLAMVKETKDTYVSSISDLKKSIEAEQGQ